MENVPADTALVAVNAVSMVKPAALSEYTNYNGNNHTGGGANGQGHAPSVVFFKVPTPLPLLTKRYPSSSYSLICIPLRLRTNFDPFFHVYLLITP